MNGEVWRYQELKKFRNYCNQPWIKDKFYRFSLGKDAGRLGENVLVGLRKKVSDEITPVSAEHSATYVNYEAKYGAGFAIDLDLDTRSMTAPRSDGTTWLKITLDKVHCVGKVIQYESSGYPFLTWTCTETDCSYCVGSTIYCSEFTLTVSTEGAVSDLSPVFGCKHGDTVKLESASGSFSVYEIAILEKPGKQVRDTR
ncbi:hypothetical protein ACHWQZ_G006516 [Mnemiopsis leidyi]